MLIPDKVIKRKGLNISVIIAKRRNQKISAVRIFSLWFSFKACLNE